MPLFTPFSDPAGSRISQNTIWTLVITALLLATGVAASVTATARADTPAAAPSQHEKPPPTPWGACPINGRDEAEHKFVRNFARGPGVSTTGEVMPGGESLLVCGHDGYGYYHIANEHGVQWTQKGVKTSENWRDVADYAIAETLKNPQRVRFRESNNAFCYSREIDLIHKVRGIVVDVFYARVVVSRQDGRVITAYPARSHC
jgi:hypothetical protein